jgi:molybdopterin converting factor subunit 1
MSSLVRVLYFARCKDVTQLGQESFEIPQGYRLCDLVQRVLLQYPELQQLASSMLVAINLDYTGLDDQRVLNSGDELAFIPPISGG